MDGRVRIGTCSGPAEAALVRAMLTAHDIPVLIGGEHHAGMLGGLGGAFVSLDIWVAREDAEDAAALLRELRTPGEGEATDDDSDAADDEADAVADVVPVERRVDQRRRTGLVLLLACCVTFGTGHLYTRAWMRGIALAALEVVGLFQIGRAPVVGAVLVMLAIVTDAVGAITRVRAANRGAALPTATVVIRK